MKNIIIDVKKIVSAKPRKVAKTAKMYQDELYSLAKQIILLYDEYYNHYHPDNGYNYSCKISTGTEYLVLRITTEY